MSGDKIMSWGDVEDDDPNDDGVGGGDDLAFLPPPKEVLSQDGTRTQTTYKKDEQGNIIKMVTKFRKIRRRQRTSLAAIKRRELRKFGDCENKPRGVESGITFIIVEPLEFEWAGEGHAANEEELETKTDDVLKLERQLNSINRSTSAKSKLASWNLKNRAKLGATDESDAGMSKGPRSRLGTYVPPSRRGGARMGGSDDKEEEYTVVITNLPEETTRDDVKLLLRGCTNTYGRAVRERGIWGFERETNTVRFYRKIADQHMESYCCFCSFTSEKDASVVISTLDKWRYGGLILGVQRTPSRSQMERLRNNAGGAEGLRPRFGATKQDPSKRVIPGMSQVLETSRPPVSARRIVG